MARGRGRGRESPHHARHGRPQVFSRRGIDSRWQWAHISRRTITMPSLPSSIPAPAPHLEDYHIISYRFHRTLLDSSSLPSRAQYLLHILPTILVRSLVVMQLLLQIRNIALQLRRLAGQSSFHRSHGHADKPISSERLNESAFYPHSNYNGETLSHTSCQHPRRH